MNYRRRNKFYQSNNCKTARQLLNELSAKELYKIFKEYGQIKFPNLIVKAIIDNRNKINTTADFTNLILQHSSLKSKYKTKKHPARKYFLALRIAVNNELENIKTGVLNAAKLLTKNKGRLVMIVYHSLEQRCIKEQLNPLCKKNILPAEVPISTIADFC